MSIVYIFGTHVSPTIYLSIHPNYLRDRTFKYTSGTRSKGMDYSDWPIYHYGNGTETNVALDLQSGSYVRWNHTDQ